MMGLFERFWAGTAWHRSRDFGKRPVRSRPSRKENPTQDPGTKHRNLGHPPRFSVVKTI